MVNAPVLMMLPFILCDIGRISSWLKCFFHFLKLSPSLRRAEWIFQSPPEHEVQIRSLKSDQVDDILLGIQLLKKFETAENDQKFEEQKDPFFEVDRTQNLLSLGFCV